MTKKVCEMTSNELFLTITGSILIANIITGLIALSIYYYKVESLKKRFDFDSGQVSEKETSDPKGDVLFKDTLFMFGNVKDGASVEHTYSFKNTGEAPISIANVVAQCGCTTAEYTHEVVAPGETGKVTATFNSSNRGGPGGILNEKSITVTFENSKTAEVVLKYKANVIASEGSVSEYEMMGG